MKNLKLSVLTVGLLAFFAAPMSYAHEEHCHKKVGNELKDIKGVADEKACKAQGGIFKHHHNHCHSKTKGHADIQGADTNEACAAKNGNWADHGHEIIAE